MRKKINWTDEQKQFLSDNRNVRRKELLEQFNQKFDKNICLSAFKGFMQRHNIFSDNNGRFKNGDVAWNAGITGEDYFAHYDREKVQENCKKMHEANRTAILGEEKIINGVPYVRVVAGRRTKSRNEAWERKRLVVWRLAYGAVPKGHLIIHLDGDRMNCELSNLVCMPKKYMTLLSKNQWFTKDKRITESAIKWCELHFALKGEMAMAGGRQFMGHNYGTGLTAKLMEEKPTQGAGECKVYRMDKEHYERTGEVKMIEYLRTEDAPKAQKMVCAKGRCVYEKEGQK